MYLNTNRMCTFISFVFHSTLLILSLESSGLCIHKVTLSFAVFIMFLLLLIIDYIAAIVIIREREMFMKSFLFHIQVIAHAYVHVL